MKKFTQFYAWLYEHCMTAKRGLAESILETPRSEVSAFELALARCQGEDDLEVLKHCLHSGLLQGDWRRGMVASKIEQLSLSTSARDGRMHIIEGRDNARNFAMEGGIALRPFGNKAAELYDQHFGRLMTKALALGMPDNVEVQFRGKKSQHIMLVEKAATRALSQAVKP